MTQLTVNFGAMADPIAKQLSEHGCAASSLAVWERAADAIVFLHVHGLATDSEAHKARGRLFARIKKSIEGAKAKPVLIKTK